MGFEAGLNLTTGDDNVAIANAGAAGDSGTIRIGDSDQKAAYIAGISGTTLEGSVAPVAVDKNGQLGVHTGLTDSVGSLAATVERLETRVGPAGCGSSSANSSQTDARRIPRARLTARRPRRPRPSPRRWRSRALG
jgi:hypothetical protein